jgi:high-affinity nickel-transport protein
MLPRTAVLPATAGRRQDRLQSQLLVGAVLTLDLFAGAMFLLQAHTLDRPALFLSIAPVAFGLGVRHAFDADHIAAIDDTTRLLLLRGRRPQAVGFFFAMGHSAVVFGLAVAVALAAGFVSRQGLDAVSALGSQVAVVMATGFLLTVALLNALVLRQVWNGWRQVAAGRDPVTLDDLLAGRGVLNRFLGGVTRRFIRSSWHMVGVGALFGLGLETASEVSLLALSATTAGTTPLPFLAILTLPLLFTAGMTTFDTLDGLLMTRLYTWPGSSPVRRAMFGMVMTALTVVVAAVVGLVYLAVFLADRGLPGMSRVAGLSARFEALGYAIVGVYVVTWVVMVVSWVVSDAARRAPPSAPS